MEGPLSPGAANGALRSPSPTPPAIDPQFIVEHIQRILGANLGASEHDLSTPGSLLSEKEQPETLKLCGRFATEGQLVLYVTKVRAAELSEDELEGVNGKCTAEIERITV
jgi:dynein heavy chain 1